MKEEDFTKWFGHYMKDNKMIELVFKSFLCSSEGGTITGLTIDGRKAKGTIGGNLKLNFTLEAANDEPILYFLG